MVDHSFSFSYVGQCAYAVCLKLIRDYHIWILHWHLTVPSHPRYDQKTDEVICRGGQLWTPQQHRRGKSHTNSDSLKCLLPLQTHWQAKFRGFVVLIHTLSQAADVTCGGCAGDSSDVSARTKDCNRSQHTDNKNWMFVSDPCGKTYCTCCVQLINNITVNGSKQTLTQGSWQPLNKRPGNSERLCTVYCSVIAWFTFPISLKRSEQMEAKLSEPYTSNQSDKWLQREASMHHNFT